MHVINNEYNHFNLLTPRQNEVFIEVITASLRITQRQHLFTWLQGSFQLLLGHEIMVCGTRAIGSETYLFDSYTSTRYFSNEHLIEATKPEKGLLSRAMVAWQNTLTPVLVAHHLNMGNYGHYVVPFSENASTLRDTELINIVAHGMSGNDGHLSTFFSFSRLSEEVTPAHAYILELLVPHLHCALTRVMNNTNSPASKASTKVLRTITGREVEILHWVHLGKTNWEIASILSISPLTVKNHVQNILRKLDVQNRGQAAIKASKLGLVKLFQ